MSNHNPSSSDQELDDVCDQGLCCKLGWKWKRCWKCCCCSVRTGVVILIGIAFFSALFGDVSALLLGLFALLGLLRAGKSNGVVLLRITQWFILARVIFGALLLTSITFGMLRWLQFDETREEYATGIYVWLGVTWFLYAITVILFPLWVGTLEALAHRYDLEIHPESTDERPSDQGSQAESPDEGTQAKSPDVEAISHESMDIGVPEAAEPNTAEAKVPEA